MPRRSGDGVRHVGNGAGDLVSSLVWHITMSLDGFIAGPDDTMQWAFDAFDQDRSAEDAGQNTGAIVAGRRWYDVATARYDGVEGIYGGAWEGPVFVLTHRPPAPSADPSVTFVSDGLDAALEIAVRAAGDLDVEVFGADIARQCLAAGYLDEIAVHIAPVLLGDGVRLYDVPGAAPVHLHRTEVSHTGQVVNLRFFVET
jgi:dihydrofolate reductase